MTTFSKREKTALLLLFLLFLSTYFAYVVGTFNFFPFVDIFLHFLGGFFVALFFIGRFRKALIAERSLVGDLIIIVGASLIVGVGWEFFEFTLGWFLPCVDDCLFRGGGLFDTLKDLVVDSFGAFCMFLVIRYKHRREPLFK